MHTIPESFKDVIRAKIKSMSAPATVEFREDEDLGTTISIMENGREVYQTCIDAETYKATTSYAAMLVDGLIIGLRLCVFNDSCNRGPAGSILGRVRVRFLDNWEISNGHEEYGDGQTIPAGEHLMVRVASPIPNVSDAKWLMLEGTYIGQTERSFLDSGRVEILE